MRFQFPPIMNLHITNNCETQTEKLIKRKYDKLAADSLGLFQNCVNN